MKKTTTLLLAATAALLASCATQNRPAATGHGAGGFDGIDSDNDIPRSEVPSKVIAAAKAEIRGFALEEADLVQRGGTRIYELQGFASGRPCQIDIAADGRVLHIERD